MMCGRLRCVFAIAFCVMLIANHPVNADEPLVFISAFAAGEQGAIHAYQLDPLDPHPIQLERSAGVRSSFFASAPPPFPSTPWQTAQYER